MKGKKKKKKHPTRQVHKMFQLLNTSGVFSVFVLVILGEVVLFS